MLNVTKKKLLQAVFVIGYKKDESIRTKQFEIEKALTQLISCASINTNLPDDFNPQAPRVVLTQGFLSVEFSQIAAQLIININNDNGISIPTIRDSILKKVNLFCDCVDKVIDHNQQRERGMVTTLHYPIDDNISHDDVVKYIQDTFFKIPPLGAPASVSLNLGYKTDDDFFITLFVNDYKMIDFNESTTELSGQWFDVSTLPTNEKGVELKIDVNSKPMLEMDVRSDNVAIDVFNKSFKFIIEQSDSFVGVEND